MQHDVSQPHIVADSKRQTKGTRTREALADAALVILQQQGYQSLSIAALADAAGIRRNSYYTHYKDLSEIVDEISLNVLNYIGGNSKLVKSASLVSSSVVLQRVQTVLNLEETDPIIASALSELYAHHTGTSREIHRRLVLDISSDRERKVLQISNSEASMAAMVVAAGVMELMRARHDSRPGDHKDFLNLVANICRIDLTI